MRRVLPTLFFAAAIVSPAAAEPFITPGVVAGAVIPALISTALEGGLGAPAQAPGAYSPTGTYVQYYDPRTGQLVGGAVPVSPHEFARREASIPPGAPVIGVRSAATVTDIGIEPARAYRHAPRFYGHRARFAGPRHDVPIYAGPRRFAPPQFRTGRPVRGYQVVRVPRGAHPDGRGAYHRAR